jgi:hypothetical protein
VEITYYRYIQDIWELDYDARLQIPVFKCELIKPTNGVSVDSYGLTLVDLKNLCHKDDPWVFADRVAQVFYALDPETGKHVVVSGNQKIVGVENVEDNDEDTNQFEEMLLFYNPMNIKHIEKTWTRSLCLICEKVVMENLYENYVSHFILMLVFVCMDLNLSHII